MIYIDLFISFIKVGLFSFGGGYASLSIIQNEIVHYHQWLTIQEFSNLITISQMTPGPIAINAATFVGGNVGGIFGSVVATLGCILPSCIIVTILIKLYSKHKQLPIVQMILSYIKPVVISAILVSGIVLLNQTFIYTNYMIEIKNLIIFTVIGIAFYLINSKKSNPIKVMIYSGMIYMILNVVLIS